MRDEMIGGDVEEMVKPRVKMGSSKSLPIIWHDMESAANAQLLSKGIDDGWIEWFHKMGRENLTINWTNYGVFQFSLNMGAIEIQKVG